MANIQERRDKNGKLISYSIRIYRGRDASGKQLKPFTETFDVSPKWTEDYARNKAAARAAVLEEEFKKGLIGDSRISFEEYCNDVIALKEDRGLIKHSTANRYRELTTRIYPAIGHIKLKDLRVDQLNSFYTLLGQKGQKNSAALCKAKIDLAATLKEKKLARAKIATETGLAASTVAAIVRGDNVKKETVEKFCDYVGIKLDRSFLTLIKNEALSAKTVIEHHRLISVVLEQAVKEQLIPVNLASKTTLPKTERKAVNYFQEEDVIRILDVANDEPMKWRVMLNVFAVTGCRRGEILGLKWSAVDFFGNRIHIENNLLYAPDRGLYEDTPKTENAVRWVSMPQQTMQMLRTWMKEQDKLRTEFDTEYKDNDYVFCQDDGNPMHPDTVTDWMRKFSERHNLPHINPHAFRHTVASTLIFHHVDDVTLSSRLGHYSPEFTKKQYGHLMEKADRRNADVLANVFLKKA